jgi:ribosome biogenesis protein Nip4
MDAFEQFCRRFTQAEIPHVVIIGKRYYYDPKGLLAVAKEKRWDAFSVGLYLGEIKKDFQPTSALIELLAQHVPERVVVGDKAAWLFLCGRDILMDGVLEPGVFDHNQLAFVADRKGNVLGYGKVVASYNGTMRNKTYLKHVLDKGEYLRRER